MAKIYGQLEYAQFEQIANASPTPAPSGRFYLDTTVPSAHVAKLRVNSTWKTFLFSEDASVVNVVTASAKTQVIDWSVAKTWIVKLANNVVFSFTNPTENSLLTLVVQQADLFGPAPYNFSLNMGGQVVMDGAPIAPTQILAVNSTRTFTWSYKTNSFSTGTALNRRSIAQAGYVFAPAGGTIPVTFEFLPRNPPGLLGLLVGGQNNGAANMGSSIFSVSNDRAIHLTKFTIGSVYNTTATQTRISPDGSFFANSSADTPFAQAGLLSPGTYVQNANAYNLASPTALAGASRSVSWHPNQKYVLFGHATTPFVSILPFGDELWGSKIADPVSLPAAASVSVAFNPLGDFFATLSATTPFLEVYAFTSEAATPIGAKSSNPSVLPLIPYTGVASPSTLAWSPYGNWIAVSQNASPYLYLVPFDRSTGGFGTPVAITQTIANPVRCIAFSPDGLWLAVGTSSNAAVFPFNQTSGALGAALTFQSGDAPAVSIGDCTFSKDGKFVAFMDNVPGDFPWIFRLPPVQAKYYLNKFQ